MSEIESQILGGTLILGGIVCLVFRRRLANEKKEMNEAWGMAKHSSGAYVIGATACGVALVVAGVAVLLWTFFKR